MFKRSILLIIVILTCSGFNVSAQTYKWYISNGIEGNPKGSDDHGDGSIDNPWETLYKVKKEIDSLSADDEVYIFLDRGDTWVYNTLEKTISHFIVKSTNPYVHFDAYGTGNRPIIDGSVNDFSTAPAHNADTGPLFYSNLLDFQKKYCSVNNIEFKNIYGNVIRLLAADAFKMSNCYVHNFGSSGINIKFKYGIEDCLIEKNIFHTGQEGWRYSLRPGWGAAIDLTASGSGNDSMCKNNVVRHNVVYDIYGEGINAPNSLIEHNIVGDTASTALNISSHDYDSLKSIVRYNICLMSDWDKSIYDGMHGGGSSPIGTRVYDEDGGGSNLNADVQIYGNIFINRSIGIWFYAKIDPSAFGSVKIYNNMVIDSHIFNYRFANSKSCLNGYFYNNASIFYERKDTPLISYDSTFPNENWKISNNLYWSSSETQKIDSAWDKKPIISNPMLPGENLLDWDNLTGSDYYRKVKLTEHLYPMQGSSLSNTGSELGDEFDSQFFSENTQIENYIDIETKTVTDTETKLTKTNIRDIGPMAIIEEDSPIIAYPKAPKGVSAGN